MIFYYKEEVNVKMKLLIINKKQRWTSMALLTQQHDNMINTH